VTFYNAGGYLQVYYKKGRFIAMAADRYDYHSRYKGSNNPKVALEYKITPKLSVRTDFGTGFRTPSAYFAYASLAYKEEDGIYYHTVPDEALKPEKLLSAEVGLHWKPVEKVTIDGSVFYHILKNQFTRSFVLLDTALYPDATNVGMITQSFVNDDTSRAELFGLQLSLKAEDLIKAVRLSGELQLSLSKGMESLPNGLGRIDSYRQWPAVFGQVNISLRPARIFYLYFRNVFSSSWTKSYFPVSKEILDLVGYDTRTKGYYTLDIVGRLSINRNFQAFFQINNVFNARYGGIDAYGTEADLIYNPQYGRNFKIGLSFTLE
jgi:outer membrane receptor protein involved in Fe transport